MKLGHIEIFVTNPLESKSFYEKILNFKVIEIQQEQFIWLESDGKIILLRPGKQFQNDISQYSQSRIALVIYTDNLELSVKDFQNKGIEFRGTDGSEKCLTFTDPDGNWIQLVNPDDH